MAISERPDTCEDCGYPASMCYLGLMWFCWPGLQSTALTLAPAESTALGVDGWPACPQGRVLQLAKLSHPDSHLTHEVAMDMEGLLHELLVVRKQLLEQQQQLSNSNSNNQKTTTKLCHHSRGMAEPSM